MLFTDFIIIFLVVSSLKTLLRVYNNDVNSENVTF